MMSPQRYTPTHKASASHQAYDDDATQRFVIGKIDAGIAVLISDSVHLIEFPSLLLPPGVGPGSIVNIACTRNQAAEKQHARDFWDLQRDIADTFGQHEPEPPRLRVRNTTQTSVTLEWDKLELASASLLNLSIYRNGQRLTTIPNPLSNTSTKLSGLSLDTDYTFHLVLKTTAGTFASPTVKTRTHTIDNTTGISVCFGLVEPRELAQEAVRVVGELGAKSDSRIQIDTTHYIATSSSSPSAPDSGPSVEYQKAVQLSIPIVTPEWLLACARAKKLVPISAYYLGQTNRAASLSSAQLVSSAAATGSPPTRPVAVAQTPSQPVLAEEPEEEERRQVIELQEDVEAPPPEQAVVHPAPAPAPAPAQGEEARAEETDGSTRGVKSEPEPETAAEEARGSEETEKAVPLVAVSTPAEEAKEEQELEVKEDTPAEELAQEVGAAEPAGDGTPADAAAASAAEAEDEPKLDAAEAGESDVDEAQVEEKEPVVEAKVDGEEEEGKGEEADTSLVDVKL
ncbi:hypothetical protein JCM10450v2_001052 [Rhodotorula kratochvilovae]